MSVRFLNALIVFVMLCAFNYKMVYSMEGGGVVVRGDLSWSSIDTLGYNEVESAFESQAPIVNKSQMAAIANVLGGKAADATSGDVSMPTLRDSKLEVFSRYTTTNELRHLSEELIVSFSDERLNVYSHTSFADAGYYILMLTMRLNEQIDGVQNISLHEQYIKTVNAIRDRSKKSKAIDYDYYSALRIYEAMGVIAIEEEAGNEDWKTILNDEYSSPLSLTRHLLTDEDLQGVFTGDFSKDFFKLIRYPSVPKTRWILKSIFPKKLEKAVGTVQSTPHPNNRYWNELVTDKVFLEHINYVDVETGIGFPMYAYCANNRISLNKLGEMGADFDFKLKVDVFDIAKSIYLIAPESSFSPRKGDTILLAAALDPFRKDDFIPIILKYTKDPNQRDLLNRNALHRILYHRMGEHQANLLKLLIDAGTDVNAESVSGNTPAHVAVYRNSHLLPLLLKAGADLTKKNQRGETPVDLLRRSVKEKWIFHEESVTVLKSLEDQS